MSSSPASSTAAASISWDVIDSLKGIGIILVVAGHAFSGGVAQFIYTFHMPLFFLISGYTLKPRLNAPFIWGKVVRILLPYVSYLVLFNAWPILGFLKNAALGGLTTEKSDFYYALALRQLRGGSELTGYQAVFWFPPCLLWSILLVNFAGAVSGKLEIALGAFCLICISVFAGDVNNVTSVLGINAVCGATCFVVFGRMLSAGRLKPAELCGTAITATPDPVLRSAAQQDRITIGPPLNTMSEILGAAKNTSNCAHPASLWQSFQHAADSARAFRCFISLMCIACLILSLFPVQTLSFNMKYGGFGIPVISFVFAVAICLVLTSLACYTAASYFVIPLRSMGRASMTIMYVHMALLLSPLFSKLHPVMQAAIALLGSVVIHQLVKSFSVTRVLFLGSYGVAVHRSS